MANNTISQIVLPNGDTYDIEDAEARQAVATDIKYGYIKTSQNEGIYLNANGQLVVNGRLGQVANGTGIYSPNTIIPSAVGDNSFLITEASGTSLGNRSLSVTTGSNLTLKTAAAAGSTAYTVPNTYENRIKAYCAIGGRLTLNQETASNTVNITSVTVNNISNWTPDDATEGDIVVYTDASVNPDDAVTSIRMYPNQLGFCNLLVGQAIRSKDGNGTSVAVGQVVSNEGNACAVIGGSLFNKGNGSAIFGRQHINKKNRVLLAGTGHNTTNGPTENMVAFGQWSKIVSTSRFVFGGGSSSTNRSNLFEINNSGDGIFHGKLTLGADTAQETSITAAQLSGLLNRDLSVNYQTNETSLSSTGWYRIAKTQSVGATVINFYIGRSYGFNQGETHKISFYAIQGDNQFSGSKFLDETSNSYSLLIDKIRCTSANNYFYFDVHYNSSSTNPVIVYFDVYGKGESSGLSEAINFESVNDLPSGETIWKTYEFTANTSSGTSPVQSSNWELIKTITTTEEVELITIDQDEDGQSFELKDVMAEMWIVGTPTNASEAAGKVRINYNAAALNPGFTIARAFRTSSSSTIYSGVRITGTNSYPGMYEFNYGNVNGSGTIFLEDYTNSTSSAVTDKTMPAYIKSLFFLGGTFGVGSVVKVFGVRR